MTGKLDNLVRAKGKFWRSVTTFGARLQALDYTSGDYTQGRIDLLERKVAAGLRARLGRAPATTRRNAAGHTMRPAARRRSVHQNSATEI
jgi:hypothetical protein